ncbi:Uncharacterised protein [Mycobacteroides abscessus subsp. abscessus]|uniref:DUF7255 family protein n=1 Tax=Mycobacteroides abscessus TaxID=36809 RepID=UPI00092905F1|nr:hypothetical protein [Mycobacteroides abscessus]SID68642.1 Uncharacterised protein [Mycobacteroides abscessus subsp. abscessus]SIF77403.1 Uncharacterised protein [Mycobacteroides abscessus subsp. abscessus]SIG16297.1 Uncharacterised protein [Mycobacteroides abscessus subsp. abscessus]SIH63839.1 Uncharacterised protein [Mycobacteroides abscessus subsp. abscessus]
MGEPEANLARLIGAVDAKRTRFYVDSLPNDARAQLGVLYRELGGILDPMPSYYTGGWDIELSDGRKVELDETRHFNRYRVIGLQQEWARELPWRTEYLGYSRRFEFVCWRVASGGGGWTNPSAEEMFGSAGTGGVLEGAGSPRWRQRALYDATKDIAALHGAVRLARLSVWDSVDGVLLGNSLAGLAGVDKEALMGLVDERTVR